MQHVQRRLLAGLSIAILAAAAACSDDNATQPSTIGAVSKGVTSGGGTDTSHTTPPAPTSNGPVASVTVTPHQVTLPKGWYATLTAVALDAGGVRVGGKMAAWRSSDPSIVIASDTGIVYGKELGTAKVYGTIDGHMDSATVTVVAAVTPPPPPPPTPAVASFDLRATIAGILPGADTSHTEPVAGAVVKLTRIGGVSGDTLSTPVDAGSATTDADGVVAFKALAGGTYSVEITPPAGSPYAALKTGIGAPRVTDVRATFALLRK